MECSIKHLGQGCTHREPLEVGSFQKIVSTVSSQDELLDNVSDGERLNQKLWFWKSV